MSIQGLTDLQKLDSELKEIEDLLGDLPSKVSSLKNEEKSLRVSIEDGKNKMLDLDHKIKKQTGNVNLLSQKIDKQKDQLFLVTSNRQYDALQSEIDHLKNDIDLKEDEIIELTEEKETIEKKLISEEENLDSLVNDLKIRIKRLEELMGENAEKKKELEIKKTKKRTEIDQNILQRYEKIFQARNGLAVVTINGSGCGGCGAFIPPQVISEVRAKKNYHNCESCSRFLISNNES